MKDYAVIGLGNFGSTVVRELHSLNCRVTVIDTDKNKVQAMDDMAHYAIVADATDRQILANLDIDNYEYWIVSTGKDSHAAILITLHLVDLGAKKVIVKANSADHAKILMKVGATQAIIPEQQMAIRLANALSKPNMIDFLPLSEGYIVAEMIPSQKFIGKSLMKLKLRAKYDVQVIAVKNSKTGEYNFGPGGDYEITENDLLFVLGKEADIHKIKE